MNENRSAADRATGLARSRVAAARTVLRGVLDAHLGASRAYRRAVGNHDWRRKIRQLLAHNPDLRTGSAGPHIVREARAFWGRYGVDVGDAPWHRALASASGRADPRYVPEDVFHVDILPALNRMELAAAYADKNAYSRLFPTAPMLPILLRNMNGRYLDAEYGLLGVEAAEALLHSARGEYVVKPSIDSGDGKGARRLRVEDGRVLVDGSAMHLREIAATYGGRDFLVQRHIRQHPFLAAFHPGSLNSVRITTLRTDEHVVILMAVLHTGNHGAWLAAVSPGGAIVCGIGPSGALGGVGMDIALCTYAAHPSSGLAFDGTVPGFPALAALARTLHVRLPYLNFVVWEFGIGEDGGPMLIDVNIRVPAMDVDQALNGPLLGEHTEWVLEHVFVRGRH